MLVPYLMIQILVVIYSANLFFENIVCLWISMVCLMVGSSWVYVFKSLGVEFGFPNDSTGLMFAIVEALGGLCLLDEDEII